MNTKTTLSSILILISTIVTILATIMPSLYIFGMNNHFLDLWLYHIYILQFFTWTFLHWWFLHLFFNSVFIFYFWNIVEWLIWIKKYIVFFVFVTIFNWVLLSIVNVWNTLYENTVWISWFCLALLSYYTLELRSRNNPEYKWWITAIIINVWIGFYPGISLYWHLFWVIAWVIYYLLTKDFFRTKYIWLDI